MRCITGILRLVSEARNPDDVACTVFTYCVDNRLEIITHLLEMSVTVSCICSVRTEDMDRFIGKLEHDLAVVLDLLMAGNDAPDLDKESLVVVIYSDSLRRHSRRTHNDVKSLVVCIFDHRNENFVKIFLESCLRESLMALISYRLLGCIVTPIRVHVHTHEIHPPSCREQAVDHTLVMTKTCIDIIVVPCTVIEERTVSLTESVQIDDVALGIH